MKCSTVILINGTLALKTNNTKLKECTLFITNNQQVYIQNHVCMDIWKAAKKKNVLSHWDEQLDSQLIDRNISGTLW